MIVSNPAFLSYLILMGSAYAQISAPNCTDSSLAWSFNSLQQNPCWVTAYLAATCNNGAFSVPTLSPQHSYAGPTEDDKGDICKCNTVVYNLISACDACQGESWIPYTTWSLNCTTKVTAGTFPNPVPAITRVPKWAYIDSSIGDNWNISAARLAEDSTTSHHSSNAGAIAGGVVGGVIGAALIVGVVVWFAIRRRRAHSSPSMDSQGGEKEQPSRPLAEGVPKLYVGLSFGPTTIKWVTTDLVVCIPQDPADPSTYPSKEYLPGANRPLGSTGYLQPSDGGYSGLPEI
ncbi:hypothetical protein EDB87DRAFT_708196 [Lactarius vividus]|nr:hypothetical protein EDB87DRAFT_708196 [Lactarius vividus]